MAKDSKRRSRQKVLTIVQTGAALAGHPHVAAALKLAGSAAGRFRNRRIERMWESAVHGIDEPLEFTRQVEQALLRDGDDVAFGFVTAAQAAADAIAPVAVASIGLLARRFLVGQDITRRNYRAALTVLRSVDDIEFGALRDACHRIIALVPGELLRTQLDRQDHNALVQWGNADWTWYVQLIQGDVELARGDAARAIVEALRDVLVEGEVLYDGNGTRRTLFVPFAMPELLASVMPLELGS